MKKMEIGKFFMKEKDILWQITIYDGYQIDVSSLKSLWQLVKQNLKYIWYSMIRPIPVTEETLNDTLTENSQGMIKAHREYLEKKGLDKNMFTTRHKINKPTYIG